MATEKTAQDDARPAEAENEEERFELGQDVYGLMFLVPVRSWTFVFAFYVFILKLTLFTLLAMDLYPRRADIKEKTSLVTAAQFCLLPVAVAIQGDLIHVFTRVANIRYEKKILKICPAASELKFALSFVFKFLDGLYSLLVNFIVLLIMPDVMNIYLSFAALQFLTSIDDIAFELAANGYLGDKLEHSCNLVKTTTLPRRVGDTFTNSLDSILFLTTFGVMFAVWIYITSTSESVQ